MARFALVSALLTALRQDARLPLARFAREHAVPTSTVARHFAYLTPHLHRHTALLNWPRAGLLLVRYRARDTPRLRTFLAHPAVNEALVTHRGQLLLEAVFPSMRAAHAFTEQLKALDPSSEAFPVHEELRREAFLSDTTGLKPFP